ncbi:glycerate kinase [Aliifodinibius salipaludis]|uniref:Glycerate kinase n=2 Tax=Fodinibius salipaludis TaxID=2032627 RepID=A0A2A2G6A2_9BACT|nr:glycerate kinase [Aliifodinibius salipaludis]
MLLKNLFLEGLEQCSPHRAIREVLEINGNEIKVGDKQYSIGNRPVYLFAVGKAAVPMYEQASEILGDHITKSLVITSDQEAAGLCEADEVIAGSHPLPDEQSLEAGNSAVDFMESIPSHAITITLISGGTSSLLSFPAEGVSVDDLAGLYKLLNNSGATIHDINTVRKHCSKVKGGQLLRYLDPNITLIDLVISDVPDDELSIVGSGPTIPDWSSFQDAYHVLLEYDLWEAAPESVRTHIEKGIRGEVVETVTPEEAPIKKHQSEIISSASKLADKIADLASQKGWKVTVADEPFNEDVEEVARSVVDKILPAADQDNPQRAEPALFIFWGESTVQVTGDGKGGRNQELALRGALKIAGYENITWLSAGTDGIDGPTDAAGAIVDGTTIAKARAKNIDPQSYLSDNDSHHFHEQMDTLLKTGPTGNNLMDVVMILCR